MAKMEGGFLRGILGNYVYRVVNGVQRVSLLPLPGTVKRTKATQQASSTFGMASALGLQIRNTISTRIDQFKEGSFTNRLSVALVKILNQCRDPKSGFYEFKQSSFSQLSGLEYTMISPVAKQLLILPGLNISGEKLIVDIPKVSIEKELRFPGETYRCRISVYVSLLRLKDGRVAKVPDMQELIVTREKVFLPAQQMLFDVPAGCLCIASLFLEYSLPGKVDWEPITSKKFNPGCMIGALITPGEYIPKKGRTWLKMLSF